MANGVPRARDYAWPAYGFLKSELTSLAQLIVPVIATVLVIGLLAGAQDDRRLKAVAAAVSFLVFAQYARVVYGGLLAGRRPTPLDLLRIDRTTFEMAWISLVTTVGTALPMLPFLAALGVLGVSGGGEEASAAAVLPVVLIGIAGLVGVAYVGARLVLALVLVAATMPGRRIAHAWMLSRGSAWLIVKIGFMTVLPLGLAAELVARLGGNEEGSLLPVALTQGLAGALNLATVAIAAHALVALYRDLTGGSAVVPSPAAAGQKE